MFGIDIMDAGLLPAMLVALVAGLLSFLSPCVLPIVPPYLAYMSGISAADLRARARRSPLLAAAFFVLGLSTVFLFLGFAASAFGAFFLQNSTIFATTGGDRGHDLRGAFPGRSAHSLPQPRDATRRWRPRRLGDRRLCAGPGLRLRLDAVHRPAARRDPDAGGTGGLAGAGHLAAWRSMRWGSAFPSCWSRPSSRGCRGW